MTQAAEVVGFINSTGGPTGFVLPVFREGSSTYIQQPDESGRVHEFVEVDIEVGELLPGPVGHIIQVGQPVLLAFRLPGGEVVAGEKERLQVYLVHKADQLKPVPFTRLDALVFAGALDDAKRAVGSIRNRLAIDNKDLADSWAAAELKFLQNKINRIPQPEARREVSLLFSEGYISWPELQRQLAYVSEHGHDMKLRLRIVRSCPNDKVRELLGSFGFASTRIGAESRLIRFNAGCYRRLLTITHVVMIIYAEIGLEDVIDVHVIDVEALRKRYYRKAARKRALGHLVPDYRYCVRR